MSVETFAQHVDRPSNIIRCWRPLIWLWQAQQTVAVSAQDDRSGYVPTLFLSNVGARRSISDHLPRVSITVCSPQKGLSGKAGYSKTAEKILDR